MRRTLAIVVPLLALALSMALSTGVALAGWDWGDSPPASYMGASNPAPVTKQLDNLHAPGIQVAKNAGALVAGNKPKP